MSYQQAIDAAQSKMESAATGAHFTEDNSQLSGMISASDFPDPSTEVELITAHVLKTATLNPMLETFLKKDIHRDLFRQVFARHCNLIKSRYQSFDDCHVTVYDKVLLRLTDNGNEFSSVAARNYFCTEFLAIDLSRNETEISGALEANLTLKAIFASVAAPDGKYGEKYSAATIHDRDLQTPDVTRDPHMLPLPVAHFSDGAKGENQLMMRYAKGEATKPAAPGMLPISRADHAEHLHLSQVTDDTVKAKIKRILALYHKARSEFQAAQAGGAESIGLESARFLRDTVENTIQYIKDVQGPIGRPVVSAELMQELEESVAAAKAAVVHLSGGRKRKFDPNPFQVPPSSIREAKHQNKPEIPGSRDRAADGQHSSSSHRFGGGDRVRDGHAASRRNRKVHVRGEARARRTDETPDRREDWNTSQRGPEQRQPDRTYQRQMDDRHEKNQARLRADDHGGHAGQMQQQRTPFVDSHRRRTPGSRRDMRENHSGRTYDSYVPGGHARPAQPRLHRSEHHHEAGTGRVANVGWGVTFRGYGGHYL